MTVTVLVLGPLLFCAPRSPKPSCGCAQALSQGGSTSRFIQRTETPGVFGDNVIAWAMVYEYSSGRSEMLREYTVPMLPTPCLHVRPV